MRFIRHLLSSAICLSIILSLCIPQVAALSEEDITAPSAILMEPTTGKVLYEKNPHDVRACASITKVMTLLLVMEAIDSGKIALTDTVTASAHAASMGGSDIWLEEGETMSVDDMVKATVVASANDAAVALAEYICGTEDSFVTEMNKKAQTLGMKETVFKNCNGLDEEGHVTSAYDVALMSSELIKHKAIFNYSGIWMDTLRGGQTQIVNTNKLLKSYTGITGLKTGTTSQAGSCISATANREGLALIAVVLGCSTGTERFADATSLLDYGFANYTSITPKLPEDLLKTLSVKKGMLPSVGISCTINKSFICEKGGTDKITSKVTYDKEIKAPINKGDKLGKVVYKMNDNILGEFPIVADNNVEKMTFKSVFSKLFSILCTY